MIPPVFSTIAQLLYPQEHAFDFARIVAEMKTVLTRLTVDSLRAGPVQVEWDQDDLVYFDVADTRILLAFVEFGRDSQSTCLTLSVGPGDRLCRAASHHAVLCSRLVERIEARFAPAATLWQEVEGPVDADVVDGLFNSLPNLTFAPTPIRADLRKPGSGMAVPYPPDLRADQRQTSNGPGTPDLSPPKLGGDQRQVPRATATPAPQPVVLSDRHQQLPHSPAPTLPPRHPGSVCWQNPVRMAWMPSGWLRPPTGRRAASPPAPETSNCANDVPDLPRPRDETLVRLREALYPANRQDSAAPSTQIRLATHCFNATLILVWLPMGAAVMTYSILKGEDFRLSSRLMAAVGAILTVAHSPYGSVVRAMAGV